MGRSSSAAVATMRLEVQEVLFMSEEIFMWMVLLDSKTAMQNRLVVQSMWMEISGSQVVPCNSTTAQLKMVELFLSMVDFSSQVEPYPLEVAQQGNGAEQFTLRGIFSIQVALSTFTIAQLRKAVVYT
mmetsp:Transcript_51810/g.112884  ORF Transcript_51810/g.112884 Transcript_51810/m.112884 type:complete len:128 (-) Transcript_51810:528-911(-)